MNVTCYLLMFSRLRTAARQLNTLPEIKLNAVLTLHTSVEQQVLMSGIHACDRCPI